MPLNTAIRIDQANERHTTITIFQGSDPFTPHTARKDVTRASAGRLVIETAWASDFFMTFPGLAKLFVSDFCDREVSMAKHFEEWESMAIKIEKKNNKPWVGMPVE